MKVVSIGDMVTDYYYKDNKLLGVNGGMTTHNIIANLAKLGIDTAIIGVCGNDEAGSIAIKSLSEIGVDVNNIKKLDSINTRCFHVSYFEDANGINFISKKRCPFCSKKRWYDNSAIDIDDTISKIEKDDVLVFDNLNITNQNIIDATNNIKMIDLGQYYELDNYSDEEVISKIYNKFEIINLNERVEKYILKRYKLDSLVSIYDLLKPKLLITTRGKNGADFIYNSKLINIPLDKLAKELDPTGAGDAFFSVYIAEYIKNNQKITNDYIKKTFKKATDLTSEVVKKMGARGHINKLYSIKAISNDICTCDDFSIKARKQIKRCNININNLEARVLNAINSSAYDKLSKIDFDSLNAPLFVGTGGSYAGACFASKVINNIYGINANYILPRDVYYRNNKTIDKVFLFSYSGTTNDLLYGTSNIDNKNIIIITKGEQAEVTLKTGISKNNILTYRTGTNKGKERGFLSFEGAVAPATLFLKLYFKNNLLSDVQEFVIDCMNYWDNYFKNYFKENKNFLKDILVVGNSFNLYTGDNTYSAAIDLESKIIESGIFNVLIHEKKNFTHGRFINYENLSLKSNIYFRQKEISDYEKKLLKYLENDNNIIIESRYNGIMCEYDLLIASQFFMYHVANYLDIDISKPKYSEKAMKIYFSKDNL